MILAQGPPAPRLPRLHTKQRSTSAIENGRLRFANPACELCRDWSAVRPQSRNNVGQRLLVVIAHNEAPGAFLDRPGRLEAGLRGHGLMIHQREHDFGYGDKADRERDNGDGELITDHLPASLHHDHEKGRPFETP